MFKQVFLSILIYSGCIFASDVKKDHSSEKCPQEEPVLSTSFVEPNIFSRAISYTVWCKQIHYTVDDRGRNALNHALCTISKLNKAFEAKYSCLMEYEKERPAFIAGILKIFLEHPTMIESPVPEHGGILLDRIFKKDTCSMHHNPVFYYTETLHYYVKELYESYVPEYFPTYDEYFGYATALLHACFVGDGGATRTHQSIQAELPVSSSYSWDGLYVEDSEYPQVQTLAENFATIGIKHFSQKVGGAWLSRSLNGVQTIWNAFRREPQCPLEIDAALQEDIEYYFGLLTFLKTRFSIMPNALLTLSDISGQRFQETVRQSMVFKAQNLALLCDGIEAAGTPSCFLVHFNVLPEIDENLPLFTKPHADVSESSVSFESESEAPSSQGDALEQNYSAKEVEEEDALVQENIEEKEDQSDSRGPIPHFSLEKDALMEERASNSRVSVVWYRQGVYTYFNPSALHYITCTKDEVQKMLMFHGLQFGYVKTLMMVHTISREPVAPNTNGALKHLTSAYYTDYVDTHFSKLHKVSALAPVFFSRLCSERTLQNQFTILAKKLQYDVFDPEHIQVEELSLLSKKILCALMMFSKNLSEIAVVSTKIFAPLSSVDLKLDSAILDLAHSWDAFKGACADASKKNVAAQMDTYFNNMDAPREVRGEKTDLDTL